MAPKGDDDRDYWSATSTQVITQRCALQRADADDPAGEKKQRAYYRCKKTLQNLRRCFWRAKEVIASQTEVTEHAMEGDQKYNIEFSITKSSSISSSSHRDMDAMREMDRLTKGTVRVLEKVGEMDILTKGVKRLSEKIVKGIKEATGVHQRINITYYNFPGDGTEEVNSKYADKNRRVPDQEVMQGYGFGAFE